MTAQSYTNLRTRALQVMNETAGFANTEVRVGSLLRDMVDSFPTSLVVGLVPDVSDTVTAAANTATLQAAVIAASAAGGARVVIPDDDFYFQHGLLDVNVVCQLNGLSNVAISGGGVGATRLNLINGADANFFNLTGASSNISICGMTINGNRANQTPGIVHGIRGDAFSGLWLDDLYIHDISHYGIGVEGFVQQYLFFSNIKLENLGGDGFDQKNKADSNLFQCANNITVTNFGLSSGTQAGWDCRGAWQMSNYVCHFANTDGSGFRIRNGENGTVAGGGFGGHRSHINGFEIYGPGAASSSTGVENVGRDVVFSNGYVRDVLFGVSCSYDIPTAQGGQRGVFQGVTCEAYGTAGFITSSGAVDNTFTDCTANGFNASSVATGTYGFRIRSTGCTVSNPRAFGNTSADISIDTTGTGAHITQPRLTGAGSPGVATTGLDVNATDVKCVGGDITGHVTNCSITAARFSAVATTFRSATTDNVLIAVGGDDASFTDCNSRSAASEGYQMRAARTTVRGGQCTGNGGLGVQTEASASDCVVDSVYMTGNAADFDDQGTNTVITQRTLVARSLNEAVAAAGTSANIDVPILPSTTVVFLVEAQMEDSASARCTLRTKVQAYRSAAGAAVVSAGTSEFSTGAGLTINLSGSGNNLRVSVTKSAGNNCRLDTRITEIFRQKTVEFS